VNASLREWFRLHVYISFSWLRHVLALHIYVHTWLFATLCNASDVCSVAGGAYWIYDLDFPPRRSSATPSHLVIPEAEHTMVPPPRSSQPELKDNLECLRSTFEIYLNWLRFEIIKYYA
jgi:hypothetical protein